MHGYVLARFNVIALFLCALMVGMTLPASVFAGPVCGLSLPSTPVNLRVTINEYNCPAIMQHSSFMSVQLSDVPSGYMVANQVYNGWCIDKKGTILDRGWKVNYDGQLYSSLDTDLPDSVLYYSFQDQSRLMPWNQINYILNIEKVTSLVPSWLDKQAAMWQLLYGCFTFESGNAYFRCISNSSFPQGTCLNSVNPEMVDAIVTAALANGADFVPGPGQKVALVLDPLRCNGDAGAKSPYGEAECLKYPDLQLMMIEVTWPFSGSIGDFVWLDKNRDGVQDYEEPGLSGVAVRLLDEQANLLASTTTGGDGSYRFTNLCAGSYIVEVDEFHEELRLTDSDQGGDTEKDSNPNYWVVNLPDDSSSDLSVDFGYQPKLSGTPCTGKIGDFVWNDLNRNGVQDPGEPGLNGVTVSLVGGDGLTRVSITDQNGKYQFEGLCPGEYMVQVVTSTLPDSLFVPAPQVPEDHPAYPLGDSNGNSATVVLAEGASDQSIDFGYEHPCTGEVGDFVWHDLNGNGVQDDNEPGINGVDVNLLVSGSVISTVTTSDDPITNKPGHYRFGPLCAGTYQLEVVSLPSPEYSPTITTSNGSTISDDSNQSPATVILAADHSSDLSIDFGFVTPCTGTVGNFIWHDLNRDGIQNAGEPGISKVFVKLRDSKGSIRSTRTDQNGRYQFDGLCAGEYKVEAYTPCRFQPTTPSAGTDPSLDSNENRSEVVLPANSSSDQTVDFGYITPCTGKIGNFVWYDKNGNGLQRPDEQGIDGAVVNLRDAQGTLLATTTTGKASCGWHGYYEFTGLCAGTYIVESVPPAGYQPTKSNIGWSRFFDSAGGTEKVVLARDSSYNLSVDFGYVLKSKPGCGSPGYWKAHPESWPLDWITLGRMTYKKSDAISRMKGCGFSDKTYAMFEALLAAKLNPMVGNDASCIEDTIEAADAWLAKYGPVGSGVRADSKKSPWLTGEPLFNKLDAYNNGRLCSPSRESTRR